MIITDTDSSVPGQLENSSDADRDGLLSEPAGEADATQAE
jgi:hypothetical protein